MKNLFFIKILIVLCMIFSFSSFCYYTYEDTREYDIKGVIRIKNGPYIKNEGKNSWTCFSIIYYSDSLKKNIYVNNVSPDVFYNYNIGDRIGFYLQRSEFDTNYKNKSCDFLILFIFVFAFGCFALAFIYHNENYDEKEDRFGGDYSGF